MTSSSVDHNLSFSNLQLTGFSRFRLACFLPNKKTRVMDLPRVRIVVVGDVHDEWDPIQDAKALQVLKPDLVLFTGDFGDENVELVEHVSNLNFPKAAILGNHDCWFSSGYISSRPDAVDLQTQSLGECHVGYKRLDFPELKLSVVGGRPFSSGGKTFGPSRDLILQRYNIKYMRQSVERICDLALRAPTEHALVFLAHNGPKGLGSRPEDICGKDWSLTSFDDHGDPDLAEALSVVKARGSHKLPLVVFGHMHRNLCHNRGFRNMLVVGPDNTLYVNAAIVPRVRNVLHKRSSNQGLETERNFTLMDMTNGEVEQVIETWVRVGETVTDVQESLLFSAWDKSTAGPGRCMLL